MPQDLKRNIRRQDRFIDSLMMNTVHEKTQCLKKQAQFYNNLQRYNHSVRSALQDGASGSGSNYDPEISVLIN